MVLPVKCIDTVMYEVGMTLELKLNKKIEQAKIIITLSGRYLTFSFVIHADQSLWANGLFPADTINLFEESFFYKKCQRKAVLTGHFLFCDTC